jgi:hypothetical protein
MADEADKSMDVIEITSIHTQTSSGNNTEIWRIAFIYPRFYLISPFLALPEPEGNRRPMSDKNRRKSLTRYRSDFARIACLRDGDRSAGRRMAGAKG